MKRVLGIMFGLCMIVFALPAIAQIAPPLCDQSFTTSVTYKGQPVGEGTITYHGLELAATKDLSKRGLSVVDAASKVQDKGGDYDMLMSTTTTCGGSTVDGNTLDFRGMKLNGVNKVMRSQTKLGNDLAGLAEDEDRKGKRRAWGKE